MEKFTVTIQMPMGLHARPANLLVKKATEFKSDIVITKDGKEVNGKRLLGVMTLGAKKGDSLTIIANGTDEKQAAMVIKGLFDNNFGE